MGHRIMKMRESRTELGRMEGKDKFDSRGENATK